MHQHHKGKTMTQHPMIQCFDPKRGPKAALRCATLAVATMVGLPLTSWAAPGDGGPGVASTGNSQITTCSTITGGLGADGTQAPAVLLAGGGNTLTLENGFAFSGLVSAGNGDTLALGGGATTHCGAAGNGSFDVSLIGAAFQGFGSLAKTGVSTWVLTGSNPAANWTASGGTLQVDGTVGAVAVNAGGTLGGTGTVGAITLAGGAVAPGNSPGTLTGASLAWNGGSGFNFELGSAPAQSDLLVLTGALSKAGGSGFVFHFADGGGTPQVGTTYPLIQFASQSGFAESDFSFDYSGSTGGLRGHFSLSANQLDFVVDGVGPTPVVPIPTMSEAMLLLLGTLLAAAAAGRLLGRRS